MKLWGKCCPLQHQEGQQQCHSTIRHFYDATTRFSTSQSVSIHKGETFGPFLRIFCSIIDEVVAKMLPKCKIFPYFDVWPLRVANGTTDCYKAASNKV
jgi:hypothetical protein